MKKKKKKIILAWIAMPFSRGSSWQELNLGLPHCRQILYCLNHQGTEMIFLLSDFGSCIQYPKSHSLSPQVEVLLLSSLFLLAELAFCIHSGLKPRYHLWYLLFFTPPMTKYKPVVSLMNSLLFINSAEIWLSALCQVWLHVVCDSPWLSALTTAIQDFSKLYFA